MRLPDWPDRLFDVVKRHRAHAFEWGVYDCGTLFAESVAAVTGNDPRQGMTWSGHWEAMRFLAANRVRSMTEFVEQRFDEIVPADARRGDVGWTTLTGPLVCPAIVVGSEAVSRDESGWLVVPRNRLVRAFMIEV